MRLFLHLFVGILLCSTFSTVRAEDVASYRLRLATDFATTGAATYSLSPALSIEKHFFQITSWLNCTGHLGVDLVKGGFGIFFVSDAAVLLSYPLDEYAIELGPGTSFWIPGNSVQLHLRTAFVWNWAKPILKYLDGMWVGYHFSLNTDPRLDQIYFGLQGRL